MEQWKTELQNDPSASMVVPATGSKRKAVRVNGIYEPQSPPHGLINLIGCKRRSGRDQKQIRGRSARQGEQQILGI